MIPSRCPKCHYTGYRTSGEPFDGPKYVPESGVRWNAPFSDRNDLDMTFPEHLSYTCRSCGYSFTTPCRDSEEPAQGEGER